MRILSLKIEKPVLMQTETTFSISKIYEIVCEFILDAYLVLIAHKLIWFAIYARSRV